MPVHITPAMIEATYELLRTAPPFRRWHLPPGDDVEFRVFTCNSHAADYYRKADGTHVLRVNANWTGTLHGLLRHVAHEMVHLAHGIACPSDQAHHGAWFRHKAAQVCRHLLLDPKSF